MALIFAPVLFRFIPELTDPPNFEEIINKAIVCLILAHKRKGEELKFIEAERTLDYRYNT